MKLFKIEIDADQTLDANDLGSATESDEDYVNNEDNDDDTYVASSTPAPRAAAPTGTQQARVNAMLNARKRA